MNRDFTVDVKYDKSAYEALSEASWQLFRKKRMQLQTYPILIALALLTVLAIISGWNKYGLPALIGGACFAIFIVAAIPLSAKSAKSKMCRDAVKEAKARGEYPADIRFRFSQEGIYATFTGNMTAVKYDEATGYAALGEWQFIFFGQAAYILRSDAFGSKEEQTMFRTFIEEKTGKNLVMLHGTGPKRRFGQSS